MPFAYFNRLSPSDQKIYRQSDEVSAIALTDPKAMGPVITELEEALESEDRRRVESLCQLIADSILAQLGVAAVQIVIREVRPSNPRAELHGLYEPVEPPYRSRISLWMRTAVREEVVAFKTFFRTLIHEVCHHLDYELLGLGDSFHTEGFYKRESSLVRQLIPR